MQASLEKIAKLKAADQVAFKLIDASDKQKTITRLGQLLSEMGIVNSKAEPIKIITAYKENVSQRLQSYLVSNHEQEDKLELNEEILKDKEIAQDIEEFVPNWRTHFSNYTRIVLAFNSEVNALREVKKGEEYREAFKRIDQHRSHVHDACLDDIKLISRLASQVGRANFVKTRLAVPNRTDYGAAIVKLCYCQMVEELDKLVS